MDELTHGDVLRRLRDEYAVRLTPGFYALPPR